MHDYNVFEHIKNIIGSASMHLPQIFTVGQNCFNPSTFPDKY